MLYSESGDFTVLWRLNVLGVLGGGCGPSYSGALRVGYLCPSGVEDLRFMSCWMVEGGLGRVHRVRVVILKFYTTEKTYFILSPFYFYKYQMYKNPQCTLYMYMSYRSHGSFLPIVLRKNHRNGGG